MINEYTLKYVYVSCLDFVEHRDNYLSEKCMIKTNIIKNILF